MGGGTEVCRLEVIAKELKLNNIFFLPQVPMNIVGSYLQKADALLVHLKKNKLFEITIPSKIQAYLAIGKPILNGVQGDAARLITSANAGINFEPENPVDFNKAVLSLISDIDARREMGENGKEYYFNNLSISKGVERSCNCLE